MSQKIINVGGAANDGTGDSLRSGAQKINDNFTELYSNIPTTASTTNLGLVKVDGTTISINGQGTITAVGYNLPIASASTLGGVKQGSNVTIGVDGTISVAGPYTLPTASASTLGGVKVDGQSIVINDQVISAVFTSNRANYSISTSNLAADASESLTLTNFAKSYMILKVTISSAAWVRFYTSQAARTADASRDILTDPSPGSGVIGEFITAGSQTIAVTPVILGFNDQPTPVSEIYMRVTNKDNVARTINIQLTIIRLEV